MTHLSKEIPYRNSRVSYSQTKGDIDEMLAEAGAIALVWTETPLSLAQEVLPRLEFGLKTERKGVEYKFLVRIQAPLLMDKKRRYGTRGEMVNTPNRNSSMRLLYWYLKARLEGVRFGMEDIFDAFMPRILNSLPDGKIVTFSETVTEHPEVMKGILPEFEIKVKALSLEEQEQ